METVYYLLHECQASLAESGITLGQVGLALLAATATLGGAWIGAERGARGAYKATARAGYDLVRREKLEEAVTELNRFRHDESPRMTRVQVTLREKGPFAAYEVAKLERIDLSFGNQFPLLTTMEIYFEEGYPDADRIQDAMIDFGMLVHQLLRYGHDGENPISEMERASDKFRDARQCLLDRLKSELKYTP